MMPAPAATVVAGPYEFRRHPGPVPGIWVVRLSCRHGTTSCYVAAIRLASGEGAAILELLADHHRIDHSHCHCLKRAGTVQPTQLGLRSNA